MAVQEKGQFDTFDEQQREGQGENAVVVLAGLELVQAVRGVRVRDSEGFLELCDGCALVLDGAGGRVQSTESGGMFEG